MSSLQVFFRIRMTLIYDTVYGPLGVKLVLVVLKCFICKDHHNSESYRPVILSFRASSLCVSGNNIVHSFCMSVAIIEFCPKCPPQDSVVMTPV